MLLCLKSCSLSGEKKNHPSLCNRCIRWAIAWMPQVKAPFCKWEFRIPCGTWNDLRSHQLFHEEACCCNEMIGGCLQSAFNGAVSYLLNESLGQCLQGKIKAVGRSGLEIARCQREVRSVDGDWWVGQWGIKEMAEFRGKKFLVSSSR